MTWPATLLAEVTPPFDDTANAITEIDSIVGEKPTLVIEPLVEMSTRFTFASSRPVPDSADVLLTIPPVIPGRDDLVFQARTRVDGNDVQSLVATLSVPDGAVYRASKTVKLVPLSPTDALSPPRTFSAGTATTMLFSIGASDDVVLQGRVLSANLDPVNKDSQTSFVARAFQEEVVSNTATIVPETGTFTLTIPALAALRPVRVQILPLLTSSAVHPSWVSTERRLNSNGTYATLDVTMPTYTTVPNLFSITVAGNDVGEPTVPNASVRAETELSRSDLGMCTFLRDSRTKDNGTALLSLLPGNAVQNRTYEIAVVPPPDSDWATLCRTIDVQAGGGGDNVPPVNLPLMPRLLPRRALLTGRVVDARGNPVRDVAIAATPGATPASGCSATRSTAAHATTAFDGTFRLALDPSTYRIEYDPPAGSALPRLTELGVVMTADVQRDVRLPEARFVEGFVTAPDGKTRLANALVRLFEPRCADTTCTGPNRLAPFLRAVAQTDDNGRFRAVVPAN